MFFRPGRLRPEQIFQDFWVERYTGGLNGSGRRKAAYDSAGAVRIRGVLVKAEPTQAERFRQLGHPVTHTIAQPGPLNAGEGDRLVLGSRYFYIQGVEDPGGLGLWALYYAEERKGVDGL